MYIFDKIKPGAGSCWLNLQSRILSFDFGAFKRYFSFTVEAINRTYPNWDVPDVLYCLLPRKKEMDENLNESWLNRYQQSRDGCFVSSSGKSSRVPIIGGVGPEDTPTPVWRPSDKLKYLLLNAGLLRFIPPHPISLPLVGIPPPHSGGIASPLNQFLDTPMRRTRLRKLMAYGTWLSVVRLIVLTSNVKLWLAALKRGGGTVRLLLI